MISGIISDTVLLNSPTTTYHDKFVIEELSKQAKKDLAIQKSNSSVFHWEDDL